MQAAWPREPSARAATPCRSRDPCLPAFPSHEPAMHGAIAAVGYHLPERVLTNAELAAAFPSWTIDQISQKTGIERRHIAGPQECASDLALAAARKLFATTPWRPEDIDFLL